MLDIEASLSGEHVVDAVSSFNPRSVGMPPVIVLLDGRIRGDPWAATSIC